MCCCAAEPGSTPDAVLEWRQEQLAELRAQVTSLQETVEAGRAEVAQLEIAVKERDATIDGLQRQLEAHGLAASMG